MSTVAAPMNAQAHANRILPLLKEYGEKLNAIVEKALGHWQGIRHGASFSEDASTDHMLKYYVQLWRKIHPPVKALIQQASQLVEHGKIDSYVDMELRLRLAELEQSFLAAESMFGGSPTSVHGRLTG